MLANWRLAVTSQKKKFNFRVWFHGHVLYVKQAYNGTVTRYMSEECSVTSRKWKNTSQFGLPGLTLEEKQGASEEIANIRYNQLPFLSESPNIILVNISGYAVY